MRLQRDRPHHTLVVTLLAVLRLPAHVRRKAGGQLLIVLFRAGALSLTLCFAVAIQPFSFLVSPPLLTHFNAFSTLPFSLSLSLSTSTVKWFDPVKGLGFITGKGDESDIFCHQSAIHSSGFRALTQGETVEYDVESQKDGRRKAANVTGPGGADIVPPARVNQGGEQW